MNIRRNKIPKKTRLFSSKPRSLSYRQLPIQNRPKTGMAKKVNNILDYNTSKVTPENKRLTSNIYINFGESLDFRRVRPKSKCQDRVFNAYWQVKMLIGK